MDNIMDLIMNRTPSVPCVPSKNISEEKESIRKRRNRNRRKKVLAEVKRVHKLS